jgi:hypothetical protein
MSDHDLIRRGDALAVLRDEIDLARIAMPQCVPILAADMRAIAALPAADPLADQRVKALVEALKAVAQHEVSIFFGPDAENNKRASWRGVMRKVKAALAVMDNTVAELEKERDKVWDEAVWVVAQVVDQEMARIGFIAGPDGFGRRAEMRNVIVEELKSVQSMRATLAEIEGTNAP